MTITDKREYPQKSGKGRRGGRVRATREGAIYQKGTKIREIGTALGPKMKKALNSQEREQRTTGGCVGKGENEKGPARAGRFAKKARRGGEVGSYLKKEGLGLVEGGCRR